MLRYLCALISITLSFARSIICITSSSATLKLVYLYSLSALLSMYSWQTWLGVPCAMQQLRELSVELFSFDCLNYLIYWSIVLSINLIYLCLSIRLTMSFALHECLPVSTNTQECLYLYLYHNIFIFDIFILHYMRQLSSVIALFAHLLL